MRRALYNRRIVESLKLVLPCLLAALAVLLRRAFGRRRVPTWTLSQELLRDVQATALAAACRLAPARTRELAADSSSRATRAKVDGGRTTLDGVVAECVVPRSAPARRTVFYIHGGGYNVGSTDSHRELVSRLAVAAEATLWSVEYRLAPESSFPAAIDDVERAWRALVAQGLEPAGCVVAGDSAGGSLALALLQRLEARGEAFPAAAVLLSPAVNVDDWGASMDANADTDYLGREICDLWIDRYLAGHDRRDPLVSPCFADASGWPPLLVHGGGREVLIDQIDAFVEKTRGAGVAVDYERLDDEIHVWHLFARFLPGGRESLERAGAWIRSRVD